MVDKECIVDKLVSEATKKSIHKMCIHNKRLARCTLCPEGGSEMCIHNKRLSRCSICPKGGSELKPRKIEHCIHNNLTTKCSICKGYRICIHNKRKTRCIICKGSEICIHNKLKQSCKICVGSSICIHNKDKRYCRECNGSGFCEHNVNKYTCKKCHGNSICVHNNIRTSCVLCKGGATCIHGKQKYTCKLCNGNGICEHNILKLACKICNGSAIICQHNKRKQNCVLCKGSNICIHLKNKHYCNHCGGSALCKNSWCESKKRIDGYCRRCCLFQFPDTKLSKNYKTKENTTVSKIEEYFPNLTWVKDKTIEGGCSMRRPDLLVDMGSHIIIIEIDENKHNTESYLCENKRICQIWNDVGERNIIFIRFNPDSYTNSEGIKIKSCFKENRKIGALTLNPKEEKQWNERTNKLLETIEYWTNNVPDKLIDIVFLFYDEIIEENDEEKE